MSTFRVRRGGVGDAAEITRVLQVAQAYTYAAIMPVQFAIDRITEIPAVIEERRAQMRRDLRAEDDGSEPFRRYWVAEDDTGMMGVACAGHGTCDWEAGFAPPPTTYHLDKLYVLPRGHGTGAGQALFEAALPPRVPAYLWILGGNPRADRFYRRNGFDDEGYVADTGEQWFSVPMYRLIRASG